MRRAALFLATTFVLTSFAAAPPRDPAMDLPDLKIYENGSPLRTPVDDWDGARRRAQTDPRWRKWLDRQMAETDEWIANRRDRADWVAGWWHDFVSPKDGSFLNWTPEPPGPNTLRTPDGDVVPLTPKLQAAWVTSFRSRNARTAEQAAALYRLTGQRRYAGWAASQIDFYADHYLGWPLQPDKGKSRLMYQSLDEAILTIALVNTAENLGDFVDPARKNAWFSKLFKPTAALLNEGQQGIHNIACWHRSAVGHIALYYGDEALWRSAVDGQFGIRRQLAEGVTADYLWFEQSLSYNSYVVRALLPFFSYAARKGRGGELRHEMSVLQNLMLSPTRLRFPTGQLPTPADTTKRMTAPDRDLLASTYRVFPSPIGLYEAARRLDWDTLLDPPRAPQNLPPLREVVSLNLESSRMALLKKGLWQVFFHYGQLSPSHSQEEALSFEAFYQDTDITHDSGTVGYSSALHRDYFKKGLAHNVPLVDGRGQARWNPGRLEIFDASEGRMVASQPEYRPGVSATRELRIEGQRLIDTLTLTSRKRRKLGLALRLSGRVELPSGFKPRPDFGAAAEPAFRYWKGATSSTIDKSLALRVRYPDRVMKLTLKISNMGTITHASAPDTSRIRLDGLYVETEGTRAVLETVIEPEQLATEK